MALSRKFLSALGIDADKIDEIIEAHTETVNALKEERDGYKADAEKLPDVQNSLKTVQQELNDLKSKSNADDPYKEQYEELKQEYENYKSGIEAKETKAKKEDAYKKLLKDAGVSEKRIASILKVSDVDSVEFDDDGKVKDADKLTETIKTEWADFIVTKGTKGADVKKPPENNGNGDGGGNSRAKELAEKYHKEHYGVKGE